MAMDWDAYFAGGSPVAAKSPDKIDWDQYFSLPNQEETASPTEPAPEFGSGLKTRMQEYNGLSPEAASGKYIAGWKDTLSNAYDTVTDPSKLYSAVSRTADAGAHAVAHPIDTAQNIGKYYYENPDAAVTDAAFAAFPASKASGVLRTGAEAKYAVPTGAEATADMLKSGGSTMNVAKGSVDKVAHEDLRASMSGLQEEFKTATLRPNAKLHPAANDLYNRMLDLVRAPKGDPMRGMTKTSPPKLKEATMQELHELRQIADDVIGKGWNPATRSATSEGKLGKMMQNTIDEMIAKHPEGDLLNAGKGEYGKGMKSKSLLNLVEQAKNTTQWDRGDHAGAIRNKINTFLKSNEARYLTKQDVKELRKIKRYGFMDALAAQGSLSPMALVLGRIIEGMTGLPQTTLFWAGKGVRDTVNARRPQEIERMAARIRAGQ